MISPAKIPMRISAVFLSAILATGCSSVDDSTRLCADDNGDFYECTDIDIVAKTTEKESHDFQSERSFQSLSEYTEQMVHQLNKKVSNRKFDKTIIVPPFSALSPINSSNPQLAVDLAEAFIIDMQNAGLPTAELLIANTSTEFQADYLTYIEESSASDDIGYIVKGTMRETKSGVMLYARIIEIDSRKVIASTSKLLPFYLIK
jgi:TolB-like protein